jgi:uncharacterized protein (TIGR02246 family)
MHVKRITSLTSLALLGALSLPPSGLATDVPKEGNRVVNIRKKEMAYLRLLFRATAIVVFRSLMPIQAMAASAEDDVKAAYATWDAAFNKGDAKALAALYADDALFLPATHDVVKGPGGVEKFFTGIFGMGVTAHKFEIIEARGEGNLIYAAAKWTAAGKDAKGADQPLSGLGASVFERQADGSLKLKLHTFN